MVVLIISLLLIIPLRRIRLDHLHWSAVTAVQRKTLVLSLFIIFIVFSHVLIIPPYMRDDVIYHLLVPKQLYLDGGFRFDPYNINSNFPMAFEMPLTLTFLSNGWVPPQLVNYLVLLCLCIAFYMVGRRIFEISHTLALSAVLLLATTPAIYDQVRSCYVELFMSLLVLVSFYNYFLFRSHRKQSRYWYLSMFFAGLLCATKYPGGIYAAFIAAVEFFAGRDRAQYYKGLLICAVVCLPWYLKNWVLLGNPVFPLLGFLFSSEFVTVERAIFYKHLFADYHWGKSWMDYLLIPWRLLIGYDGAPEVGNMGFGGKLSFYFICAFASVAALVSRKGASHRDGYQQVVGLLFVTYLVFWAVTSQQVRFLLPAFILASLSGLCLINKHWKRLKAPAVVVIGLILLQNSVNIGLIMKRDKIVDLISRQVSQDQFLDSHMPVSHKMAKKLNRLLDHQDHRLLAIGNFGRNYYYDVEVITNTYYEAEILARAFITDNVQPKIFEDFVKKERITHLLINFAFLNQFFAKNPHFDMDALKRYLSHKPLILTQKAVAVYQL